jgi:hypothetical protein
MTICMLKVVDNGNFLPNWRLVYLVIILNVPTQSKKDD